MAHRRRRSRDASGGLGEMAMDEFGASHGGWSCSSCSRGPVESIRTPVMVPGEAVWAVVHHVRPRRSGDAARAPRQAHARAGRRDSRTIPKTNPRINPMTRLEDDPQDEPDTLYFGR